MIAAGIAFILDCILGDPRTNWHPVVLIGRLIGWLEHVFYRPKESDARKFFMGLLVREANGRDKYNELNFLIKLYFVLNILGAVLANSL